MKKISLGAFLLMFTIGACQDPLSQAESFDYTIEQAMGCYCPQGGVWVKLFVRADTIAKAIDISQQTFLTHEQWRPYRTIKGLFREITLRDTSMYDVEVVIDSSNCYPTFVYFNPKPVVLGDTVLVVIDGHLSYSSRNLVRLN